MTDPISLAVSTAQQAVVWAEKIVAASRNKREATAARTIAYAGAMVADIHGLRDASVLLHPLTTFRAAEWPPERRQAWIERARTFDRSRDIWTDLGQHIFSLNTLPLGTDKEALALRSRLIELAADVAHTGRPRPRRTSWMTTRNLSNGVNRRNATCSRHRRIRRQLDLGRP